MQYPPLSPVQNQAAFQNMVQPVNQGSSIRGANSELSPNSVPRSFNSTQLGSPYSPLPGLQYPGVYSGGPINHLDPFQILTVQPKFKIQMLIRRLQVPAAILAPR